MGDVLAFKRPEPKPKRKRVKSDNLTYPTEQDQRETEALIKAFGMHGLDVEIIPADDGA